MKKMSTFVLIAGLAFGGCVTESPKAPPPEPVPPILPDKSLIQIYLPESAPPRFQEFVGGAVSAGQYMMTFIEPARTTPALREPPKFTWRYKAGTYDVIIKADVLSDQDIAWECRFDGGGFDNVLAFTGTSVRDFSSASWELFNFTNGQSWMTTTWQRTPGSQVQILTQVPRMLRNYEIVGRADSSGTLIVSWEGVVQFHAQWGGDGHGQYNEYHRLTGQPIGSESW